MMDWKISEKIGTRVGAFNAAFVKVPPRFASNDWRSMYWKVLKHKLSPDKALVGYEWATKEFGP